MTLLDDFMKVLKDEGFWSEFLIVRRPGGWVAHISPGTLAEPDGPTLEWPPYYEQVPSQCQYEACRRYLTAIRGKTIRITPCGMWQNGSRRVPIPMDLQTELQL